MPYLHAPVTLLEHNGTHSVAMQWRFALEGTQEFLERKRFRNIHHLCLERLKSFDGMLILPLVPSMPFLREIDFNLKCLREEYAERFFNDPRIDLSSVCLRNVKASMYFQVLRLLILSGGDGRNSFSGLSHFLRNALAILHLEDVKLEMSKLLEMVSLCSGLQDLRGGVDQGRRNAG